MSGKISINLDEGSIELNDGLSCDSLLDRITVCRNCGKITFLPQELTGRCIGHKCHTLRETLERQKSAVKRTIMSREARNFLTITILSFVVIWSNVLILSKHLDSIIEMVAFYGLRVAAVILLLMTILQVIFLGMTWRSDTSSNGFLAFMMRKFAPNQSQYKGQNWEQAICMAYSDEIGFLEEQAHILERGGTCCFEDWTALYSAAMELSYCFDCEQLAVLRLACLSRIPLLPQTYTDIRQIIQVISPAVMVTWLETIVVCLEHLCIPCDEQTAKKILNTAAYCILEIRMTDLSMKDLLARCFIAVGPYYLLQDEKYISELRELYLYVETRDPVFAEAMRLRKNRNWNED